MPLFRRPYDRNRLLDQATRARARGHTKKAIAAYQQILEREPANHDLHRRIAPLLAAAGRPEDAWASYRTAVRGLVGKGFLDQAVGVLREAADALRRERAVWERLAEIELERGRPVDAHAALLAGRRQFRARRGRADAIRLLARARKLAPDHFAANFDLAGLLAAAGEPRAAGRILEQLAAAASGPELRRARARLLRLRPSPTTAWAWLRSLASRRRSALRTGSSTI